MLRRLVILASGGLLLLGAACGSDSKDSSTDATKDADTTVTTAASADNSDGASSGVGVKNCEDIGADDIAGVFGGEFSAMKDSSRNGAQICDTQRGDPVTAVQYTIKPNAGGEYDRTIDYAKESGATAESLSGVGDRASRLVTKQSGVTVIQVIAVKGSTLFYVTVSGTEEYPTQTEQVAKLLADLV